MERRAGELKMPRHRQGSISLFASLPARWDQGLRIWKLRLFDGQATPQMRGLIWEQLCSSDSVVTADGAQEKTRALVAHVDVGENGLGNSAEQICWPLLWYKNGVFTDCNFSLMY